MSTKISSTIVAAWEKIMAAKILSSIITALTFYLVATVLISIFKLNSSPDQIFLSKPIKPEVIELGSQNLDKLNKEINNIKSILVFTIDDRAIYLVPDSHKFTAQPNQTSIEEMILQYVSGSNSAYATNCPDMTHYKHGICHGPGWDGGIFYAERICECVLKQ
ncbi:hypothetical protein HS096_05925 [candidate division WWE3 bacterium]|uniref:Uncharacterized protein n=1 Tax=candidate division WWE3 bacterium TaxID=2053526 RepID=A0A928TTH1_UNCKA|nr:hypothetical protein [candidate division WWE3 bacterium]